MGDAQPFLIAVLFCSDLLIQVGAKQEVVRLGIPGRFSNDFHNLLLYIGCTFASLLVFLCCAWLLSINKAIRATLRNARRRVKVLQIESGRLEETYWLNKRKTTKQNLEDAPWAEWNRAAIVVKDANRWQQSTALWRPGDRDGKIARIWLWLQFCWEGRIRLWISGQLACKCNSVVD